MDETFDPPRERISKIDQRLHQTAYDATASVVAVPFIGIGTYFTLAGMRWIPLPGKANVPDEVIVAAGLAFAIAGLWLAGLSVRSQLRRYRLARSARAHPDEPWYADFPWEPAGARDRPARRVLGTALTTLFMVVFFAPFNWWAFGSKAGSVYLMGVVGLFDIVIVWLIASTVHRLLAAWKYGPSQLSIPRCPFHPGDPFQGTLSPLREGELTVTLRFVEERFVSQSSGSSTSASHEANRLASVPLHTRIDADAGTIVLEATLPDDPRLVNQLTADPAIRYWELLVETKGAGIDYRTTFPVPVYLPVETFGSAIGEAPKRGVTARAPLAARTIRAFELKALLVVLVVGASLAGVFWETLERKWTQALVGLQIETLPGVGTSGLDVETDEDGTVWVLSKTTLHRVDPAHPDRPETIIGPGIQRVGGAFSSLTTRSPDAPWVGKWRGGILDAENPATLHLEPPSGERVGRITAFAMHPVGDAEAGDWRRGPGTRTVNFVLGRGLWRVENGKRLVRVEGLPARQGYSMKSAGKDGLYVAMGTRLWRSDGTRWDEVWRTSGNSGRITVVLPLEDGSLWVGARRGLFRLQAASPGAGETQTHSNRERLEVVASTLSDVWVKALAFHGPHLWVGSWDRGLLLVEPSGGDVIPLAAPVMHGQRISDITFDREGGLWLTIYGGGARYLSAKVLGQLAR